DDGPHDGTRLRGGPEQSQTQTGRRRELKRAQFKAGPLFRRGAQANAMPKSRLASTPPLVFHPLLWALTADIPDWNIGAFKGQTGKRSGDQPKTTGAKMAFVG